MIENKVVIFANGIVGLQIIEFLISHYKTDISSIVLHESDTLISTYLEGKFDKNRIFFYAKDKKQDLFPFLKNDETDYFILAWWGYIIKEPIISLPKIGIINFHPSWLPYNRGKHYNFWTLVEDCPFGVSLHFVNEGIDTGDIIYQQPIDKTWEDTGKSLYEKAQKAIVLLFVENYENIRQGNYSRQKQDLSQGSYHLAKEIDQASIIYLDKSYTAKDLLNLLRARTFEAYPSCWFEEDGHKYEVRVQIKKLSSF